MRDVPGDTRLRNLRFKASDAIGNSSSTSQQGSHQKRLEASAASNHHLPCTVDGAVLLETEQVLLRAAPHLLAWTARIRKDGWTRPEKRQVCAGFTQYRIAVPIEAVTQILAAVKEGALVYGPDHEALQKLVKIWNKIHERCSAEHSM